MINLSEFGKHNNKKRKRLGRGSGSGHGQTSGKGNKGQNARAGGGVRPGFEGGQMPYIRRVPKRGFNNPLKERYAIVNLDALANLKDGNIDIDVLKQNGILKKGEKRFKLLGSGEIDRKLNIVCNKISKKAKEKIENNGGAVRII
ncbi:MAG: 50S ribosomal protein L15 [Candidatus Acidulodesulfobacterium ferriphilum]|jgi:large subunit ribosomal protein L15|uniref:Large ribosomal subunit protein uL15 n=1 Tax=Candidatus Acidulodesulfobacterium ferriphilum TaxID=2597223 RepID=A0A519BD11_9DELT|nr:50S ribosomal protein L15 [Deltaproteobacteria bacterium]MCL5892199.1 50S ribosomal protein L15 [Deltaproteobacteria bacterium]MDA8053657.1 50S ribosomal protein L15 [Deltaproteobacteria bacterium]MDA8273705.1 50S ribosomal protein L15 [Deltaproteobacteria bacterium]RZD15151.1 MAG: 50S ribosomal protein L15 [Candidatus Acidulodesulfobacterium ferriphilum]